MVNIQENDLALVTGGISETGAKVFGGVVGFILGGIVCIPVCELISLVFCGIAGKEYKKVSDDLLTLNARRSGLKISSELGITQATITDSTTNDTQIDIADDTQIVPIADAIKYNEDRINKLMSSPEYKRNSLKMVAHGALGVTVNGACIIGFTVAGVNIAKHLWKKSQKVKLKMNSDSSHPDSHFLNI